MTPPDERSREEQMTAVPETVAAADVADWSDDVDVVVVGFGIA